MAPEDVTSDWLSGVLGAEVEIVRRDRIGDGLVGMNLRLELRSDGRAAEHGDMVPTSVVVKLPSPDPTSRATGVALRNYEREVKFYLHVADTVAIRVPRCHHGEWDPDDGDFVLVLEDMAPAEPGDQIAGCPLETAERAVEELARLHGPRWDDASLADLDWLGRRTPEDVPQMIGLWQMFFPGFASTYRRYLDDDAFELVERFGGRLGEWIEGRGSGPLTVTHGDYRLDNLLFGTSAGGPPVTAVDWQTPGHGPAAGDLAYFLGAGLLPEQRRVHERDLVARYADCLTEFGVDVDRDRLWNEYVRDAFAGVIMSVVASQVVGASARSEAMFAAMATRHLQHALDLDAWDAL